MQLLSKYINGNYSIEIYDDGTKIRETEEESFDASFPENIDIKITNYCLNNCSFCFESSSSEGKHIMDYNLKETSQNNIGQFIQNEELFLKQGGKFVKQEGKFHIDFSDAAKEHLSKRNEVVFTEERLGYGRFKRYIT